MADAFDEAYPAVAVARQLTVERARVAASLAPLAIEAARWRERAGELIVAHAAACADAAAIAALEAEVFPAARAAIQRYTRDAVHTDEVMQQLRIHLLVAAPPAAPRLARFDGRAPLAAWVAMCAARLALHALRAERARRDVAVEWTDALLASPAADPVVEELRARHAARVADALAAACLALSRRQRAIVRLLFVDGASVDEVAAMYQVHRVTVWRWVQDARATLAASARASLGELGPDARATDSFVAWVEDQVELSLDSVLAPTATHPKSA